MIWEWWFVIFFLRNQWDSILITIHFIRYAFTSIHVHLIWWWTLKRFTKYGKFRYLDKIIIIINLTCPMFYIFFFQLFLSNNNFSTKYAPIQAVQIIICYWIDVVFIRDQVKTFCVCSLYMYCILIHLFYFLFPSQWNTKLVCLLLTHSNAREFIHSSFIDDKIYIFYRYDDWTETKFVWMLDECDKWMCDKVSIK